MGPLRSVPRVPWSTLRAELVRDWQAGQHVTVIGPTGSGKTHLALTLAEMCRYILVLAAKRQDPLVHELETKGYLVTGDLGGILWTHPDHETGRREPLRPKVVFWPRFPERMGVRQRLAEQADAMRKAIDWADKTGGWAVVIDETMWMADRLGLGKELDSLWFQGRTQGLSVIACAQRPSRVPRLAFSQADYLFIAKFADKRDIETLRDISSSIPKELIEGAIQTLSKDRHEFLFVDTVRDRLAVTVAPPR
jgi:energy-coupling factor transporter ATP-binding protein EcfA2